MKTDIFFFHNVDTCIGCCACQVACKDKNNLQPGEFFRRVFCITLPGRKKEGFISLSCNHCENPACIEVCPNNAFYKAEDGTVLHDDGKCIGCGRCVWSCPFGEVSLSQERGVAQKCDGCVDLREAGKLPACVGACVTRSLQFGKTDGRVDMKETTPDLLGILPSETGPRVCFYVKKEDEP